MILEISEVSKSYTQGGEAIRVLTQMNLGVRAGETVAILGQSGSGKSTLLSLIAGLDRADEGDIRVAGESYKMMNEAQRTQFRGKNLGIVFQQFHLLPQMTALENVMIPLEIRGVPEAAETARRWLDHVGLGHRTGHRPHELSGGECQRVAIARALVAQPQLILADEPSGSLDIKTGDAVMTVLFDVVEEFRQTLVLVTHSLELARHCHRQLYLREGRLWETSQ
jgi:putative ABC transport system ATP-binding protein